MAFALEKFTPALIRSVNVRAEMHGPEPVPAADIGFRVKASNNLLALFSPILKPMLYTVADDAGDQPDLDGIDPTTDLPSLRSAVLGMPLSLKAEYAGRNLVIDYGLGGKSNIELHCDLTDFQINCLDGGTVEYDFRAKASGLGEKVLGRLASLIKHDVSITILSSPEADGTQERIPDAKPAKKAAPVKTATDLFVESAAPAVPVKVAAKKAPAKKPASFKAKAALAAKKKAKR